ncbi:MAG: energy transducer TonB [Thiobacillus sp.]|nr:energy transducer TonB [Thiobacillus sp.]
MTQLAIDVPSGAPRLSPAWLGAVVLVHAGLLAVLLDAPDTPEETVLPRPLTTVRLIEPEAETPQPRPNPTPPRPAAKSLPIPPLLAAKTTTPVLSTPQPVAETPKPLPLPEPDVLPSLKPSTEAVFAPAPAPPPIIPPRPADYLANPKPPYPSLSRRQGEEGTVRLSILVNPDGSIARLELAQSSGHPRLDRAAMDTVQSRWTFEPARQGGKPVTAWVIVPIQFTLRS